MLIKTLLFHIVLYCLHHYTSWLPTNLNQSKVVFHPTQLQSHSRLFPTELPDLTSNSTCLGNHARLFLLNFAKRNHSLLLSLRMTSLSGGQSGLAGVSLPANSLVTNSSVLPNRLTKILNNDLAQIVVYSNYTNNYLQLQHQRQA